jgi:prepilin-type N-terminal cleavage/methylation domain-containing protein/prepilin-type processing-associated H-X9-DG protein
LEYYNSYSTLRPQWDGKKMLVDSKSHKAFTLIELLVVIAIISIIAAILFPVFSTAREKGRQAACLSNNHQLNLAFAQYEQDYDETLPNATDGAVSAGRLGGWVYFSVFPAELSSRSFDVSKGSIYAYVKNAQVYICPSDSQGRSSGDSYAANSCLFVGQGLGFEPGKSLGSVETPASFMLLGEEAVPGSESSTSTDDGYFLYLYNVFTTRHTGGTVVSFVDGHTKWYRPDQIASASLQTGGVYLPQCP